MELSLRKLIEKELTMSLFQGIVIGVCVVSIIFGVVIFGLVSNEQSGSSAAVVMWGTVPESDFGELANALSNQNAVLPVVYSYHDPETFDRDLLEALASGVGPDLVLLPHEEIFKIKNRLLTIPFKSYPLRDYKDTFIEQSEIFVMKDGIIAVPYSIDPIVMYWNRTMFTKAGIPGVPKYWDDVVQIVPRLSEKDSTGTLRKSALTLGEFSNISYAKEILATLLMQSGSRIVEQDDLGPVAVLDEHGVYALSPAETAVSFFSQFGNPAKPLYSWSKAFPNSIEHFAQGDVAMLFAKASDIQRIQDKNINLNFDVAEFPVPRDDGAGSQTFGSLYGIGIISNSQNTGGAFNVIIELTNSNTMSMIQSINQLPPVRRDIIALGSDDAFQSVFYKAALRSRAWFDPDYDLTYAILRDMVESVVSGKSSITGSTKEADERLDELLLPYAEKI